MSEKTLKKVLIICFLVVFISIAAVTVTLVKGGGRTPSAAGHTETRVQTAADGKAETETESPEETERKNSAAASEAMPYRGTASEIPTDIQNLMMGKSMKEGAKISFDELAYLKIPHYDFNGNVTEGELVVNKKLADEVLDIFAELFEIRYPIEKMRLVDDYNASDFDSIDDNNTSAFNYRVSTAGTGSLSKHALGCAIDINPQINPYVASDGRGSHSNAAEYWSRDKSKWTSDTAKRAYIGPDSEIYYIFVTEHHWEWGGSWSGYLDYQHFQKSVN